MCYFCEQELSSFIFWNETSTVNFQFQIIHFNVTFPCLFHKDERCLFHAVWEPDIRHERSWWDIRKKQIKRWCFFDSGWRVNLFSIWGCSGEAGDTGRRSELTQLLNVTGWLKATSDIWNIPDIGFGADEWSCLLTLQSCGCTLTKNRWRWELNPPCSRLIVLMCQPGLLGAVDQAFRRRIDFTYRWGQRWQQWQVHCQLPMAADVSEALLKQESDGNFC